MHFPFRASEKGHYEVIRVLAAYGADLGKVNTQGNTSMHIAAMKGYGQICKFLAQRGELLRLFCDFCSRTKVDHLLGMFGMRKSRNRYTGKIIPDITGIPAFCLCN